MVLRPFSPARACWPAVVARLAQTLGAAIQVLARMACFGHSLNTNTPLRTHGHAAFRNNWHGASRKMPRSSNMPLNNARFGQHAGTVGNTSSRFLERSVAYKGVEPNFLGSPLGVGPKVKFLQRTTAQSRALVQKNLASGIRNCGFLASGFWQHRMNLNAESEPPQKNKYLLYGGTIAGASLLLVLVAALKQSAISCSSRASRALGC